VEGYKDGMRPLQFLELSTGPTAIAKGIAMNLARLHYGFRILPTLSIERRQPTLWTQLFDWLDQAEAATFEEETDRQVVSNLELPRLRPELAWLQEKVVKIIDWNSDPIVFCHNDLLAANILYNDTTEMIQLIDFEYGGINYRAFDIANHFNEYAGGPPTDVRPDYNLLPTDQQQRYFIRTYLENAAITKKSMTTTKVDTIQMNGSSHDAIKETMKSSHIEEDHVDAMMKEVEIFLIVNHLYWGLWGINQASIEGCTTYNYMTYGVNRIEQYWTQRSKIR
jgi:ethanolamine kinase